MTGRLVNLGSLCIDRVYQVDDFVGSGETIAARNFAVFPGGKGLNQSIAARRSGVDVLHFGCVGSDGLWLRELLEAEGVDVGGLRVDESTACAHAVIQVTPRGDNAIVITGGSNRVLTAHDFDAALSAATAEDWLLLQNETNDVARVLGDAKRRGLRVCLNLAPYDIGAQSYDLSNVDLLVVNEVEAAGVTGIEAPSLAMAELVRKCSGDVILTLGSAGCLVSTHSCRGSLDPYRVSAVDGTGAGDAFVGTLLASLLQGKSMQSALTRASAAGALAVTRPGAASALPTANELDAFMREHLAPSLQPIA